MICLNRKAGTSRYEQSNSTANTKARHSPWVVSYSSSISVGERDQ